MLRHGNTKWDLETVAAVAEKFSTRTEFKKKASGAYQWASNNKHLDEVCAHMLRHGNTKWDLATVATVAKKFSTRGEFEKKVQGAYKWARHNNLLDEVCVHMKVLQKSWCHKTVATVAMKYGTRSEFQKKADSAYQWAKRNKHLDEVCAHMSPAARGRKPKWDLATVAAVAKKFSTRGEFEKKARGAYQWAQKNKRLDEVCAHMKPVAQKPKWDLATVTTEAMKYGTRTEFKEKANGAYQWAFRNKHLNEVCAHMKTAARKSKWDLETVTTEAMKYGTRKDFEKKARGAYKWAFRNKHLDEVCAHMKPAARGRKTKWDLTTVATEAMKYGSRNEFHRKACGAYEWAARNNHLDEVCAHMEPGRKLWDLVTVATVAKKFSTRMEFQKKARSAYGWARQNKHLDEVCSHMKSGRGKWDLATVATVAKRFNMRGEFQKKAMGAYQWAVKNKHLDKVCAHMSPLTRNSKWDLATVATEAMKYGTRTVFKRKASGAYDWAFKNNHLDEVCAHMNPIARGRKSKWDLTTVAAVAKKFSTRREFNKQASSAYKWAFKNKHLDEVCAHMNPAARGRKSKWNLETVAAIAKKFSTRGEFQKKAKCPYQWARRNDCLDEVCSHMKPAARKSKWDLATVAAIAKKFSTRGEFQKKAKCPYQWARQNNHLDEVCSHMLRHGNTKWDLATAAAVAEKFSTRTEFKKKASGAYRWASQNNHLDEVCAHMSPAARGRKSKWDLATVAAEAMKYGTRTEFRDHSQTAYQWALNNRRIDEVCAHMEPFKNRKKWDFKTVAAIAKNYKTRTEFQKQDYSAFNWASNRGYIDEVCAHIKVLKNIWCHKTVATEAMKYGTRTEFKKKASGAYDWARQNNHLDEVCAHMNPAARGRKSKWDLATLAAVAVKFSTRTEFKKKASGAYDWGFKNKHLDEVCAHMSPAAQGRKPKWDLATVAAIAKKFSTRGEFQKKANGAYEWARRNNCLDEVCAHMNPAPQGRKPKWDLETVAAIAKKFSTRGEFQKKTNGAYEWARQNNQLDEVCAHMNPAVRKSTWDLETVAAIAKKFSTRGEFKKKASGTYQWARKNKHLDDVCTHMDPAARKSKWDLATIAAVAKKFSTRSEFQKKASGAYQWAFKNKHLDEVCAHMMKC